MSNKLFRYIKILCVAGLLHGCATTDYVTHYGLFTAENSVGELRQFRVYWQIMRIQGWDSEEYRALPVILETQCSERQVLFFDESFGDGRRCKNTSNEVINFCGRSLHDTDRRGLPISNNTLCGSITDRNGASNIMDLKGEVLINIDCRPSKTEKPGIEKTINTDYLKSSQLPYVVSTKQVKGGNIEDLVPDLFNHSSVCESN